MADQTAEIRRPADSLAADEDFASIKVRPLSGALGAEISGVDLARPLGNSLFAEIHRAFMRYQVIFFRDQVLTQEQHMEFSARFGALQVIPFVKGMDEHPEIIAVVKEAEERHTYNFGGKWHSDLSFQEAPPLGSALYARDVPDFGGDTMWCNMYGAYEHLSPGLRRLLDGLTAVHSARRSYGPQGQFRNDDIKSMSIVNSTAALSETEHPVVRTHPETGRKCLFVNPVYTIRFKDMTEEESRPLLRFLQEQAVQPENTCRFRWTRGTLALWDNRCTQHLALNDYDGQRREMNRTTITGDRPY